MPLFVCDECGYIDNTATTGCSWPRIDKDDKRPILCSKCCSNGKFISQPRKLNRKPTKEQLERGSYWGRMFIF